MNTHSVGNEMVCYVEQEVDHFDFTGCEVVRKEMFSDRSFSKATLKSGSLIFNVFAIKKLDECTHIQIFLQPEKKRMIVTQSAENEENAVQWCRLDKKGKVTPKKIAHTAKIYDLLKWNENTTALMSGALDKSGDKKRLVFCRYN